MHTSENWFIRILFIHIIVGDVCNLSTKTIHSHAILWAILPLLSIVSLDAARLNPSVIEQAKPFWLDTSIFSLATSRSMICRYDHQDIQLKLFFWISHTHHQIAYLSEQNDENGCLQQMICHHDCAHVFSPSLVEIPCNVRHQKPAFIVKLNAMAKFVLRWLHNERIIFVIKPFLLFCFTFPLRWRKL